MPLDYGWVTKTQRAITDALVSGKKLTQWELGYLRSISSKLDKYGVHSRITDNQDKKLLAILSKVEKLKAKNLPPAPAPPAPHAPMTAVVLGIAEWDSYEEVPPEPLDISYLFTTSPDSYEERPP